MHESAPQFFERRQVWISQLIFLALILFSLRDVLALPGTIGRTWDWEVPVFPEQILQQISRYFYVWDYQVRGGFYSPYRPEGLYYLLSLPLAFFDGEVFTKVSVIVLMFIAANTMRRLAQDVLGLSAWWSTVAGVLYMLSPVFYSRLMAGHLHMLTPYSLLPLFFTFAWRTFHGSENRLPWRDAVATGVLFGLEAIHPSFLMISGVVLGIVVLFRVLRSGIRKQLLVSGAIMGVIFSLISAFWALPSFSGYLTTGTMFHSGWPTQQPDQVTPASVVLKQSDLNRNAVQPVSESLRLNSATGYVTEFAYPVPKEWASLWLLASFLLPMFAFATLLSRNKFSDGALVLAIFGLLGVSVISGPNILTGALSSQWLLSNAFPVWAEFANTVRALPLVALSYAALAPLLLQRLVLRLGNPRAKYVGAFGTVALAIFTSPFLSGFKLIDQSELLTLRVSRPTTEDRQIYDYLRTDASDFRVTFVSPPWMYFPQYYDLAMAWTGGLSPHPEFLQPYFDPETWQNTTDFRGDIRDSLAGKMLGLAAVQYVIYPKGKFVSPMPSLFPKTIPYQDYSDQSASVARVLQTQKNLEPLTLPFTTTIYSNENYLPHIYVASQSMLVQGDSSALPIVVDSSLFDGQPAIFIDSQQPVRNLDSLASQVDRIVLPKSSTEKPAYPGAIPPTFLLDYSSSTETSTDLVAPRDSRYDLSVRISPFQFFSPSDGDTLSATFNKAEPDPQVNWNGNVPYDYDATSSSKSLQVDAYLNGSTVQSEYIQMERAVNPFDLAKLPNLRVVSQVENPMMQAIQIVLGLDFDGDGIADADWTSQLFAHVNSKSDSVDAFAAARQEFPDRKQYHVVRVAVRFQKSMEEWMRPEFPQALYAFTLSAVGFFPSAMDSVPGWVFEFPATSVSHVSTLSWSFDGAGLAQLPATLEYRVDGPATLYLDTRVIVLSDKGQSQVLETGSLMVEPFSANSITIDARYQLHQARLTPAGKAKIEIVVHRLLGNSELRPTKFALMRLGIPGVVKAGGAPTLTLDDKLLMLKEMPSSASQPPDWYTVSDVALSQGSHRLSIMPAADAAYKVDSIELEPVTTQSQKSFPAVSFQKIDPTRYVAHIENAQAPFFLVFSESFHAEWKAFVLEPTQNATFVNNLPWYSRSALLSWLFENNRHEVSEHYRVNGYANSWHLTQTGSYDVVLEFVPQRLYEGGWIVSLATLTACAIFLTMTWLKQRGTN